MRKLFKQSLSLVLAALMVLAMVPAMPLVADAADEFVVGETVKLNGNLPAEFTKFQTVNFEKDYIYEGDQAYGWSVYVGGTAGTVFYFGASIKKADGTAVQSVSWTQRTIGSNGQIKLFEASNFGKLTADMLGDFILTVQLKYNDAVIAQMTVKFSRVAAPVETEPVETEPVETEPAETEPVEFIPGWDEWVVEEAYAGNIIGAFTPNEEDFVYEADETINWKAFVQSRVAVSDINVKGILTHNGQKLTKELSGLSVEAGNTLELCTAASFPEVVEKNLYGNFELVIQVAMGKTLVATGTLRFTRNEPDVSTDFVRPGIAAKWIKEGYEWAGIKLSSHDHDYVYYGNDPYDWKITANVAADTDATVFVDKESVDVYVETIIAKEGKGAADPVRKPVTVTKGQSSVLVDSTMFSQLKDENGGYVAGNFTLIVKVYTSLENGEPKNAVAQYSFMFSRKPQMNKVGYRWDYTRTSEEADYSWLNGKFITKDDDCKYGAGQKYDWMATINPSKATALDGYAVYVEAEIRDLINKVEGSYPVLDTYQNYCEISAENKTVVKYSDFVNFDQTAVGTYLLDAKVYAVPVDAEGNKVEDQKAQVARLYTIFSRVEEVGAYPGGSKFETNKVNALFSSADEDLIFIGDQSYDWRISVQPGADYKDVVLQAQIKDAEGNSLGIVKKTLKGTAGTRTVVLGSYDFEELTTDKYGTFTLYVQMGYGNTVYVDAYAQFSRIPGEAPEGTTSPITFNFYSYEHCGDSDPLTVINNSDVEQTVTVQVSIVEPDGTISISTKKSATVAPGGSGVILKVNEINSVIPREERNQVHKIVVQGYWGTYNRIYEAISFNRLPHTKEVVAGSGISATCTTPGLTDAYKCPGCGWNHDYEQEEIPALGHTDEYTDNGDGTHTATCSACGNTTTESHTFTDGTCACGATEVLTDANLKFYSEKGDLMLGDEIKGSFVMNAKNRTYDDYYVEFKMGEDVTKVPVSMSSGNYRYFFYTVFAFKMTETVEVTLYGVKDEVAYRGQSLTWTVRDSIIAKLDSWIGSYETDSKKAAACDLLANMLNYGTEAQKVLNAENTNYPTDNLDAKYVALIKTTTPTMGTKPTDDESGKQATVYRMGMMLQEKIKLYAQFKVSNASNTEKSDYTVVIELTHKDGSTTPYEFTSEELTISGTKTKYVTVYFDKVNCQEMRCSMKFALYLNGVQISADIVRSADMLANDLLGTYPTLIPAIMNYSDCAETYFSM